MIVVLIVIVVVVDDVIVVFATPYVVFDVVDNGDVDVC